MGKLHDQDFTGCCRTNVRVTPDLPTPTKILSTGDALRQNQCKLSTLIERVHPWSCPPHREDRHRHPPAGQIAIRLRVRSMRVRDATRVHIMDMRRKDPQD